MTHILCLGTSHTEGGWSNDPLMPHAETKQFQYTWPGILEQWLNDNGQEATVINMGEASYSISQYGFKLIESIKRWPIDTVLIEVNTPHKLDIEISEQLHGKTVKDHTLESRYSFATNQGRTPFVEKSRPYRTSISSQEAVDYYQTLHAINWKDPNISHSSTLTRLSREIREGMLPDQVQNWVKEKIQKLIDHMPGTDRALEILTDYMYFQSVYCDLSDDSIIRYLSDIDHMVQICKNHNVKCWLWFMHPSEEWNSHPVYVNTFKSRWSDSWLFDHELYDLKAYLESRYSDSEIRSMLGDTTHYKSVMWQQWIDRDLGPWLKDKLI